MTSKNIASICSNLFEPLPYAALEAQAADALASGCAQPFAGTAPAKLSKGVVSEPLPWQSHAALEQAAEARAAAALRGEKVARGRTHANVFCVAPFVRHAFAAILMNVADSVVPAAAPAPAADAADAAEPFSFIPLIDAVVARGADQLRAEPLCRANGALHAVTEALAIIVGMRLGASAKTAQSAAWGHAAAINAAAERFVNFLKCIAWTCASLAFVQGCSERPRAWSLNADSLCTILRIFGDKGLHSTFVRAVEVPEGRKAKVEVADAHPADAPDADAHPVQVLEEDSDNEDDDA